MVTDPFNELNDKLSMIKIFEYLAFGLPIVLYDLVEGRRSASHAALYARNNDPVNFARQIERLLESETLRREMGARGKTRTLDGMNWDAEKVKLLAAYGAVLSPKPAVAPALTAKPKCGGGPQPFHRIVNRAYYVVKPWLPLALRLALRRRSAISRRQASAGDGPSMRKPAPLLRDGRDGPAASVSRSSSLTMSKAAKASAGSSN